MAGSAWKIFEACEEAILNDVPTSRPPGDKEFHFQRWVQARIEEAGYSTPDTGRNTYPDFPIIGLSEAYEVKGITEGSRQNDFDCNSALPSGAHDGLEVMYIFGRYERGSTESPRVLDLAIVHGSFLNAGGGYEADNKSMRVLGSYGDVLLRDRKMYVAYTPYRLLTDMFDKRTLVLPSGEQAPSGFQMVGEVERTEHAEVLVGYEADLRSNTLTPLLEPNPQAGQRHPFRIWRTEASNEPVEMRT